jgi:hypothetical protein
VVGTLSARKVATAAPGIYPDRCGLRRSSCNLQRREALGDDFGAVTGTLLDKVVDLDTLARMEPRERS